MKSKPPPAARLSVTLLDDPDLQRLLLLDDPAAEVAIAHFILLLLSAKKLRNNGIFSYGELTLELTARMVGLNPTRLRKSLEILADNNEKLQSKPWITYNTDSIIIRNFSLYNSSMGGSRPGAGRKSKENQKKSIEKNQVGIKSNSNWNQGEIKPIHSGSDSDSGSGSDSGSDSTHPHGCDSSAHSRGDVHKRREPDTEPDAPIATPTWIEQEPPENDEYRRTLFDLSAHLKCQFRRLQTILDPFYRGGSPVSEVIAAMRQALKRLPTGDDPFHAERFIREKLYPESARPPEKPKPCEDIPEPPREKPMTPEALAKADATRARIKARLIAEGKWKLPLGNTEGSTDAKTN